MLIRIGFLLLIFGLAGCGLSESIAATQATEEVQSRMLPEAGPNNSIVYFYGEREWPPREAFIYEEDQRIGVLALGKYTFLIVAPGTHTYLTKETGGIAEVIVNARAGETHYVKYSANVGGVSGAPNLEVVPNVTGESIVPTLPYIRAKFH